MQPTILTATLVTLLATGGTIGYVLLPEDEPQYTTQEQAWIQAAFKDYQTASKTWWENVTVGDPMETSDRLVPMYNYRAANITTEARDHFRQHHLHAEGVVFSLYNTTMEAFQVMADAATTVAECLDCPHARAAMNEALAAKTRVDEAWSEALA